MMTIVGSRHKCYKKHYRETNECPHWLTICNLCGSHTFCDKHGCSDCGLKVADHSPELSLLPDDERQTLIRTTKREKPEVKNIRRKRKTTRRRGSHRDAYLDDILNSR